MTEFRSAYSGHVRHTSLTGNGHEPEYEYKVTETGRELVKTGENDVYSLIQSRLDETKIENIIKRATYDPTALGNQEWQNSAQMVDITGVPTDYHTWFNRIEDAKKQFEALPIEIKNNRWGIINKLGDVKAPFRYTFIGNFNNGKAEIAVNDRPALS